MMLFERHTDVVRRWGRSNRQIFTLIIGITSGTIFSLALDLIFFRWSGQLGQLIVGFLIFEPVALLSSIVAAIFALKVNTEYQDGKSKALMLGFISVFFSKFLVAEIFMIYSFPSYFSVSRTGISNVLLSAADAAAEILLYVGFGTIICLFIPEIAGASVGYLVWRFLQSEAR